MANADSTSSTRRTKERQFYVSLYLRHVKCDPCAYCGGPATCLDHITAQSLGGINTWENAAAICVPCNSSKGTASPVGFLGWLLSAPDRARAAQLMASSNTWRRIGQ